MDTGPRIAAAACLIVAALTLSACAAAPPQATPDAIATQQPVATASASATVAPAPSPTPPADCADVLPAATVDSFTAQGLVLDRDTDLGLSRTAREKTSRMIFGLRR